MNYEVQVRRAAELDIAEAQTWYERQQTGLGAEFRSEVSMVFDRLAETPLIYQVVHRDVRRAIVHRFPYLVWYRVATENGYRSRLYLRRQGSGGRKSSSQITNE